MYLISDKIDDLLKRTAEEAERYVQRQQIPKLRKILIPTSYLHVQFNRIVDYILAISLKIRGAEIIPVLCNGFHSGHCPVHAGVFVDNFDYQCQATCNQPAHRLWKDILGYQPARLSDFFMDEDDIIAEKAILGINHENYREYFFEKYNIGDQAAEVVANTNNLSKVLPHKRYLDQLHLHAKNAVKMILAYQRVLQAFQPDLIVGSLHDHYQWSTLYHVGRMVGIDYYSHTMVEEPGCAHFGRNVDKVCEVTDAWATFQETPVDPETWSHFDKYMSRKMAGKSTCFNIYPAAGGPQIEELKAKLDPDKPVAFFPSNVPWDSAIHNYCFVSADREIINLIHKTVSFFNAHPEFQLIIKAHPYEQMFKKYDFLPHTLKKILEDSGEPLGPNIFFVDADSTISIFDIYPLVDLGIVHSSRSGCELAMHGVPVILTGDNHYRNKGFTIDVADENAFYQNIENMLRKGETRQKINQRIWRSKKYWLLYNLHGFVDLGLFSQGWTKPVEVYFQGIEDFIPGRNRHLDYVCDAIMTGKPVFGDLRWPPISFPDNSDHKKGHAEDDDDGVKISRYWPIAPDTPRDIQNWADNYHVAGASSHHYGFLDMLAMIQKLHGNCYIRMNIPINGEDHRQLVYHLNLARAQQLWTFMHPFEKVHLVKWLLTQSSQVEQIIDIGAHVGGLTLPVAMLSPNKKIIAVEPMPENCVDLEKNIVLNRLGNIQVYRGAVGRINSRVFFYPNALHDGMGGLTPKQLHGTGDIFVTSERIHEDYPAFEPQITTEGVTMDELVGDKASMVVIDIGDDPSDVLLSGAETLETGKIHSLLIISPKQNAMNVYRLLKNYFKSISTWIPDLSTYQPVKARDVQNVPYFLCKDPYNHASNETIENCAFG